MNPQELEGEYGIPKLSPTATGERLLKEWLAAAEEAQRHRRSAERYTNAEKEAEAAFGKWLLPEDAAEGEKVCMWNGSNLIQVEKLEDDEVRVSIRIRKKKEESQ